MSQCGLPVRARRRLTLAVSTVPGAVAEEGALAAARAPRKRKEMKRASCGRSPASSGSRWCNIIGLNTANPPAGRSGVSSQASASARPLSAEVARSFASNFSRERDAGMIRVA